MPGSRGLSSERCIRQRPPPIATFPAGAGWGWCCGPLIWPVVGVGAGLLAGGAPADVFVWLMVLSGFAMAGLDAWSNPLWLKEYAGLSLLAKFALLGWFAADPAARPALFWTILVFSVIFAHAPASFRHRSIR